MVFEIWTSSYSVVQGIPSPPLKYPFFFWFTRFNSLASLHILQSFYYYYYRHYYRVVKMVIIIIITFHESGHQTSSKSELVSEIVSPLDYWWDCLESASAYYKTSAYTGHHKHSRLVWHPFTVWNYNPQAQRLNYRRQYTPHTARPLRLGAHWQLKSCGDKKVAVTCAHWQLKSCLYGQLFSFGTEWTSQRQQVYVLFCLA